MGECQGLTSTWILSEPHRGRSGSERSPVSVGPGEDVGRGGVREKDSGGHCRWSGRASGMNVG